MSKRRTILVTGSSGLIGTNLALRLIDEGHCVIGLDRRLNSWTDAIETHTIELWGPSGIDDDAIGSLLEERGYDRGAPDVVIHLAALAKVYASVCAPEGALDNVMCTHGVLEYCRLHGKPIIFASSREVYGNVVGGGGSPVKESSVDHRRAASPYAAGKIAAEALVASYDRCYDIPSLVLRFSNVYGRFDTDVERTERVIPLFTERLRKGLPLTIYGREKRLDFTFIDDTVDGLVRAIAELRTDARTGGRRVRGRTLNVASGQGRSLVELATLLAERLDCRPRIIIEPARTGEVCRYVADITAAEELLGYRPHYSLPEGLDRAFAWRREWEEAVSSSLHIDRTRRFG